MKRFLTIFAAAMVSAGAFAQTSVPREALGTVRYEVRYKLKNIDTKVAEATVSLERSRREDQPVLHAHASVRAQSVFRLFLNAQYLADSYMTLDGTEPVYYMNPVKRGGKEGKFECAYDKAGGTVRTEFVRPPADPVIKTIPYDGGTMDLLSLLQFVRFQDFTGGKPVAMLLLMGARSSSATLTFQGIDTERFPGKRTERLHLKMHGQGLMENGSGDEITVWRSTGNDRTLMALETSLGSGMMTVTVSEE